MPNTKKSTKGSKPSAVKITKKALNSEDEEISDPEVLAEAEYAREHGQPLPIPMAGDGQKSLVTANLRLNKRSVSETSALTVKANQAKAARKARGRGVSGTMSKKDKSVACGRFMSLSEWDDCYEADFDDEDAYLDDVCYPTLDEECTGVFDEGADGEFDEKKAGRFVLMDHQVAPSTAAKIDELDVAEGDADGTDAKVEGDGREVTAENGTMDEEPIRGGNSPVSQTPQG